MLAFNALAWSFALVFSTVPERADGAQITVVLGKCTVPVSVKVAVNF
jgi:hypothetical protein